MFHGTVCAGSPRREVAGHDRDPHAVVDRGEEQRARRRRTKARAAAIRPGSTSGCVASTSSERWRSQRLRSCGTTPAIVAHTRSQSQWYLSSGIQSAALAEAAQVGREHDVAGAREHVRVRRALVVLLVDRRRRSAPCPDRARGSRAPPVRARPRSCGTSRYAGTDIVASVSNTTRSRRYVPQSTLLGRLEIQRHGFGRAARASRRAARAPGAPRARSARGRRAGSGSASTLASCWSRQYAQFEKLRVRLTPRRAPNRARRPGGGGTRASPTRPGSARDCVENTRPAPSPKHHASG